MEPGGFRLLPPIEGELSLRALVGALPTNPVRQFQLLYCLWIAVSMLRFMPAHLRFYRWFYSSGCAA